VSGVAACHADAMKTYTPADLNDGFVVAITI
jgi:hypothetical protein